MKHTLVYGSGINKPLFNVLTRLNLTNKKILSIGCGSAALEHLLETHYHAHFFGIDYSPEAIAAAKKRIHSAQIIDIEKHASRITTIFGKEQFDLIICADVLEHIRNPESVLKQCSLLLKHHGQLVVSIPNVANWSVRLNLLFGRFTYADYGLLDRTHVRLYTKTTAKKLIKQAGYTITRIAYSTSLINILLSKFRKRQTLTQTRSHNPAQSIKRHQKGLLRHTIKTLMEKTDAFLTKLFPGLCAYQFIIIAEKKY